jgi:hypothetical protein
MKFSAVRFSTSVVVFDDRAVGVLKTYPNESSLPVDSIEAVGQLLVITRTGADGGAQIKAVPLSKMESGDPVIETEAAEPAKRGPGRPRKEEATA